MKLNLAKELAVLEQMTVGQLQQRYTDVFGEAVRSRHKQHLIRRIAWRLQANAEGGLSERALRRAEELANVADARVTPPLNGTSANLAARTARASAPAPPSDPRLPPVGAAITREYKGRTLTVTVLAEGFEWEGERYGSLTGGAKAITGSHMNGFRFFKIAGKP
jgi:hypothetical protein